MTTLGNQENSQNKRVNVGQVLSENEELISDLFRNGSIEFMDKPDVIPQVKEVLPYGMSIYMPVRPNEPLLDSIPRLKEMRETGFDPIPHIPARRIYSRNKLQEFLKLAVEEADVHRVLLIGGDIDEPVGPYNDAADILRDGILTDYGIREVELAGYPEGHPRISKKQLNESLLEKIELAASKNLGTSIVTQFSFVPSRIVDYCDHLYRQIPDVPVYIGMAGPIDPLTLMKYARICGVNASLRALNGMGFKATKLISHTDPDKQLAVLARYIASKDMSNILGVHIFSFGGFMKSANWIQEKFKESN